MNKYQREKWKRMKKLSELGVGHYQQKKILRKFSFEQVDIMIDQANKIKKGNLLEIIGQAIKELADVLAKILKK